MYGLFEVFTQQWLDGTSIYNIGEEGALIRSIQDHLSRLLNARQGVLVHLPDYGLPDTTQFYGDIQFATEKMQAAIAQSIDKYEPRLSNVEIVKLEQNRDQAILIFEIHATLPSGEKAAFKTYLTSEGTAKVIHRKEHA
jgi:type VI secretion system protein